MSPRLARAQWSLLVTLILAGHAVLSPVAWLPDFVDRLGVSYSQWGTILGFAAVGAVGALVLSRTLLHHFGSRPVMRFSLILALTFLVSLGFVVDPWTWALLNAAFTFFFTLFGNAVNIQAVLLQGLIHRPIVGRVQAGWSIGALGGAATGALSTTYLPLEWYFVAVATFTLVGFEILRPALLGPDEDGHHSDRDNHVKRSFWEMPARLWVLSLGLVAAAFPEFAIVDWAAIYASEVLGVPIELRVLPFAAFMVGMISGRLSLTPLVERFGARGVSTFGALLAGVAMIGAVLASAAISSSSLAWAVTVLSIGWFVVGSGLGGVAPTFFAEAPSVPNSSTAWALSRMQLVAQFSMLGLKSVMGLIAEQTSVTTAFMFPAAVLFVAAAFAWFAMENSGQASPIDSFAPTTGSIVLPILGLEPDSESSAAS